MVGDQDGSTPPELVAELAELVPNGQLVTIAGAGHLPCVEQPDAVAAAMLELPRGEPPWLTTATIPG